MQTAPRFETLTANAASEMKPKGENHRECREKDETENAVAPSQSSPMRCGLAGGLGQRAQALVEGLEFARI